jgi:hypothetical protein
MTWETLPIFLLGALTVSVAMFWSFHQPHGIGEVRYATPRERYPAAVAGYLGFGIVCYVILWCIGFLVGWIADEKRLDLFDSEEPDLAEFVAWVTLAVVLGTVVLLPTSGPTARLFARAARVAQGFAGYPSARRSLVAAMSAATFEPRDGAREDLAKELDRYGIDVETIGVITDSAYQSLLQTVSLNLCLVRLSGEERSYAAFLHQRRRDKWESWQQQYQRLLRRTARALLSAEAIADAGGASDGSLAQARLAISNFVVEGAEELLGRGRRLLAELALSTLPAQAVREDLLKSVGYVDIRLPRPLPVAPVIIVLGVEFVTFMMPVLLNTLGIGIFPNRIGWDRALVFAFTRAVCQAFAITLALYPKTVSNFARPSMFSLPWRSYALFGTVALFGTATIFFIMFQALPPPDGQRRPLVAQLALALGNGVFFLATTVIVSWLIDRRLRLRISGLSKGRLRDALVCGAAGAASMLAFGVVAWLIGPLPNLTQFVARFSVLLAIEGAVIGYFVPALAAAHLLAPSTDRAAAEPSSVPIPSSPARPTFAPAVTS